MRRLLLFLLLACDPPDAAPPDPLPDVARFEADAAAGPALRLEGMLAESTLTVEVIASDVGSIFGVAGRLAFSPDHLAVAGAQLGTFADTAQLLRVEHGAVVFGLAGAPLEGPIATVRFDVVRPGDSRLELVRSMVRRADGSFVPAAFAGASVHTIGGAP
jgi:hypothetical protein